jgi:hypothetical protein
VRRGYLRDYPIGGGDQTIVPISVNYWLAVKHGAGRASVDFTTSKGSGGPPAGAGQYLEIWISPEGAGEAPGPSALTLGVPPVTAMPPAKLLADMLPNLCRRHRYRSDAGDSGIATGARAAALGRFAVAHDAQRDDSGLATTRDPGNVG